MSTPTRNPQFGHRRISYLLLVVGVLCAYWFLSSEDPSVRTQSTSTALNTDITFPFQYGKEHFEAISQIDSESRIAEQVFASYTESGVSDSSCPPQIRRTVAQSTLDFDQALPPTLDDPETLVVDSVAHSQISSLPLVESNADVDMLDNLPGGISQELVDDPLPEFHETDQATHAQNDVKYLADGPNHSRDFHPGVGEPNRTGTSELRTAVPDWNATESSAAESSRNEVVSNLSEQQVSEQHVSEYQRSEYQRSEQTIGAGGTTQELVLGATPPLQSAGVFPPAVLPFGSQATGQHEVSDQTPKAASELPPLATQTSTESKTESVSNQSQPLELVASDTDDSQNLAPLAGNQIPEQAAQLPLRAPYEVEEPETSETISPLNRKHSDDATGLVSPETHPLVTAIPSPPSTTELLDWWNYQLADPSRPNATVRTISLGDLIASAVEHSPRIRTLQRVPQISATQIDSAKSVFDPIVTLNNRYTDTMDPVGNTLTTGGAPFLQDNIWDSIGRVSKRLNGGSDLSVYQKLGFKNSNSNFFTPQDQGTATIGMDLRVPLMNGSGYEFNQTPVVIAELESSVAWEQYQTELQKEILDLATLYWNLHNARAIYLQQRRSVQRAEGILQKLEARVDYDASISQVAQAKAELSLRVNELQTSIQSIVELEISIRERIGDPELEFIPNVEVIPSQFASELFEQTAPDLNQLMAAALENRFELKRDETKIQVADRQVFLSRSRLAPQLDMVFNVYQSSLQDGTGIERAYQQQFSNSPGFAGGLEYEIPYGRRSAKAAVMQAELQRLQAADLLQIQRNEIIADVQKAFTRWMSARASYVTAKQAVTDMRKSVEQLEMRWEDYAFIEGPVSQGATPSLALDQLLAGQRRLSDTEARLANAELNVALAQQGILSATGTLLTSSSVSSSVSKDLSANDTAVPVETLDMPQGSRLLPLFNRQ